MLDKKYIASIETFGTRTENYSIEEFYKRLQCIRDDVEANIYKASGEYILEPEIEFFHERPIVSEFTLYLLAKRKKEDIEKEILLISKSVEEYTISRKEQIKLLELEMAELEKG